MADAPPPAESPPPNGPAPGKPAGPRPWQGGRFRPKAHGPSTRRRTILVLLAVILALAGAWSPGFSTSAASPARSFDRRRPRPVPDPRVPLNPWTAQDRDGSAAAAVGRNPTPSPVSRRDLLVAELRTLGRQPAGRSAAGDLPAAPTPCRSATATWPSCPATRDLDDESTWLPLREVLGSSRAVP